MKRERDNQDPVLEYNGFTLGPTVQALEVVEVSNLSAVDFFERFISQRKPCLIKGMAELLPSSFGIDTIKEREGDCVVEVEEKPFGSGKRSKMRFAEFCSRLENEDLYMTTQKGQRDTVSVPLKSFVPGVIPLRLPLAGNLKVSNLNMWVGKASKAPSVTPLHADFHDNFYLLLSGRKRFALFSPADALRLKTEAPIMKVHANGLINFEGLQTHGDGSTEYALALKRLAQAEAASDDDGMDDALDRLLELEEADLEDLDEADENFPSGSGEEGRLFDGEEEEDDEEEVMHPHPQPSMVAEPNHFCQTTAAEARSAGLHSIDVDMSAGMCLFLPTGWFHQVTSFSDPSERYHLAINWWLFPPDTKDFEKPYSTIAWL